MEVYLEGTSPGTTTVGILLLTKARQLGYRLTVGVVGDPEDIVPIPGPALLYAPVLASCGVGRELGSGGTVVIPGPPGEALLATVHPHGETGWFEVDRSGNGSHPATQAFVRLSRDPRPTAQQLGRELRKAMEQIGLSTDPAVLDVMFSADIAPLTRIMVALRAGRAMSGARGESITRFFIGQAEHDPLPPTCPDDLPNTLEPQVRWILSGLSTAIRDRAERCLDQALELAREDGGRDLVLVWHLAEVLSHLVQLPVNSMLPPLGAAEDSVATGLRDALRAEGEGDANRQLGQMFRFLGGRYVSKADHVTKLGGEPPPPPSDKVGRWRWFCTEVRAARRRAEALWPNIVDPPQ